MYVPVELRKARGHTLVRLRRDVHVNNDLGENAPRVGHPLNPRGLRWPEDDTRNQRRLAIK